MVLRRPSARSREGLNDGHRRTSAGEQSRTRPAARQPGRAEREAEAVAALDLARESA